MRIDLRYKLFLYTGGLMAALLLLTLVVLERTQSRQWEEHFQVQSVAFARLAAPELLKRFRGEFAADSRPLGSDVQQMLAFNRDLIEFSLISPSGRSLYHSPRLSEFLDLDLSRAEERHSVLLDSPFGVDTATVLRLPGGSRVLELATPALGPTGEQVLTVRYAFSYDSVDYRLREVRHRLLMVALSVLAFALILAALVARRVTRPIQELTDGVRFITRGELQTRIRTVGHDEIAMLGRAFNEMAESLAVSRSALTEKNQQLSGANEELRQMQEQLIRAERLAAIGQLAAGVSHEIDNPVGIILGYAELLLEDCAPDDPRRDDLLAIIAECKRCRRITGGLLGFARTSPQSFDEVHLDHLIDSTLASLRPQKLFKGLHISVTSQGTLQPLVADADQLRQVLVNLLLNSAQAMAGEGQVQIDLGCDSEGCTLTVRDNGPGIPESMRESIFEPFVTSKGRGEGTGLGLSVCRKLIENHGGRITLVPANGGGATFNIWLPRQPAEKCFDKGSADY